MSPTCYTKSLQITDLLAQNATGFNSAFSFRDDLKCDVLIAGSGPIGATYAKLLVKAGYSVVMCEIGASDSFRVKPAADGTDGCYIPGAHKKNEIEYQKDIDRFVHVIQGALSLVSVPVKEFTSDTLDPAAWASDLKQPPVTNGKNPSQSLDGNLSAQAVTRGVGGMTTHWTCATPRFHYGKKAEEGKKQPVNELPSLVEDDQANFKEWKRLYKQAEQLIGTTESAFDESIRHNLVLRTLQDAYKDSGRVFKELPLACHREENPDYVNWHATDTILEDIYTNTTLRARFKLLSNTRVTRLAVEGKDEHGIKIGAVELKNLLADVNGNEHTFYVRARTFVVAAGAVATPQILFNSGFNAPRNSLIPNLGRYITEQPMSFCQIVLKQSLLESIPNNPYNLSWWKAKVDYQMKYHPEDPLKFPFRDAEPQVTTPVSDTQPYHTQIHRDAFSYGAVAATIDTRTIVDLRFFGFSEPVETNTLTFETEYEDGYGMPQPTFNFHLSKDDKHRAHEMMADMCEVASKLGGFLPGSEPQFMAPGLALHLAGTVRAGLDPQKHVADTYCKVNNFGNLYVGGNGVIPTGFAANPTLTSIGYAVRSAEHIIKTLGGKKLGA